MWVLHSIGRWSSCRGASSVFYKTSIYNIFFPWSWTVPKLPYDYTDLFNKRTWRKIFLRILQHIHIEINTTYAWKLSLLSHSKNWLSSSVRDTSSVPGDNVPQQTLVAERPLPARFSSGFYTIKKCVSMHRAHLQETQLRLTPSSCDVATLFNLPPELTGYMKEKLTGVLLLQTGCEDNHKGDLARPIAVSYQEERRLWLGM